MNDIKIMQIPRKRNDFQEAEEAIKKMCKDGWNLISVTADPGNMYKLIAVFQK
ncbi:MAG: hypothetical protein IJV50_07125 [Lachnospiraceae bacterium]|nr:hypothetical protein [Lachnospiraceae bacterium]